VKKNFYKFGNLKDFSYLSCIIINNNKNNKEHDASIQINHIRIADEHFSVRH
jgi:hypothetical protein